jgi:hypothetical protein
MIAKIAAAAFSAALLIATTPAFSLPCPGDPGDQVCCSARNCTGKIQNNRDEHNCKNGGNKSWHAKNGACKNL